MYGIPGHHYNFSDLFEAQISLVLNEEMCNGRSNGTSCLYELA